MWKYIQGVEPPKKKIKRDCESHRKPRSLKESWKTNRPWLEFRDDEGDAPSPSMICKVCTESGKINEFVKGCKSLRLESVKIHESSEAHKHACEIVSNREKKVGERPAEKAIQQMNSDIFEKLLILFRNAHAIAKKSRPFSDYQWLYSSVIDNEIAYMRYVVNGVPFVKFLGCMNVQKADAKGILNAMKRACEMNSLAWDDIITKMVALGSDGASVMQGANKGVAALLKQENPSIVSIHCLGHRLELAYKDAMKSCSMGEKICTILLMGLYYFYHNSPLNRSNLKMSSQTLGVKLKLPTRVGGTRWIGHILLALSNFFHSYSAILLHLEQLVGSAGSMTTAKSKAKCFMKLMKDENMMLFAALLHDALSILSVTSKVFQREDGSVADIHQSIQTARKALSKNKRQDGPLLEKMKSGQWEFKPKLESVRESFETLKIKFLDSLDGTLASRFSDVDKGIVKSTKIIDFTIWPDKSEETEVEDFGDEEIKYALQYYDKILENTVAKDAVLPEWTALKLDIYESQSDVSKLTWQTVSRKYNEKYLNILKLIYLMLTLPSSSSHCERGFSLMNKMKTHSRSCLSEQAMCDNLVIQMESDPIERYIVDYLNLSEMSLLAHNLYLLIFY
ncbi:hypothetical protein FSP39_012619 [Pinctada imbricata]|uniref:Uncharacterized protein n=1 Tax=Pinctada imbricata TaxID=66713 RepID=A0AA89BTR3_PINIB|nr:hypothetical protein FSP39_012619 [Pinctada imbricata]